MNNTHLYEYVCEQSKRPFSYFNIFLYIYT